MTSRCNRIRVEVVRSSEHHDKPQETNAYCRLLIPLAQYLMSAFTIHLTVTGAEGAPRVPLTIEPTITSTELRERAAEATNIPLDSLKLIFRGRLIGSNETLQAVTEFKLEDGSVLHCMGKPASVASTLPSVSSSSATENSSSAAAPVAALPTNVLPFTAPPSIPVSVPVSTADPLSAALATLRAGLSPAEYLTAVQTIEKIVSNIVTQPMEEKYRSLKKSNAAFQRKLGGKNGGDAVMRAAGFTVETREEGIEYYALQASADAWPKLLATQSTLQTVVRQAQAAIVTPVAPFIPPIGGGHSLSPNMNQAAADFLSNPAQVQAMLQVSYFKSLNSRISICAQVNGSFLESYGPEYASE